MATPINRMRLSFIWTATIPEIFATDAAGKAKYWVNDAVAYAATFNQLSAATPGPATGTTLPWPPRSRQRFWSYYAESKQAQLLTANKAWKLLVPLRMLNPPIQFTAKPDLNIFHEGYLFPHGVAFVMTINVSTTGTLAGAVERAVEVRWDQQFTIPTAPAKSIALASLADEALSNVIGSALAGASVAPGEPFCVLSMLAAEGKKLTAAVKEGSDIHRAIHGLATLSKTWKLNKLPALAEGRLRPGSNRPAEHFVYAAKNGRVVWHPHFFGAIDHRSSMNCYHRNLVFASLQAGSLLTLISHVSQERKQGNPPSGTMNDCVRRASGILGRMFGGEKSTYRSWSVRRQLLDSDALADISDERVAQGMAPLQLP